MSKPFHLTFFCDIPYDIFTCKTEVILITLTFCSRVSTRQNVRKAYTGCVHSVTTGSLKSCYILLDLWVEKCWVWLIFVFNNIYECDSGEIADTKQVSLLKNNITQKQMYFSVKKRKKRKKRFHSWWVCHIILILSWAVKYYIFPLYSNQFSPCYAVLCQCPTDTLTPDWRGCGVAAKRLEWSDLSLC